MDILKKLGLADSNPGTYLGNGEWSAAGAGVLEPVNPANGEVLGRVATASQADYELIVKRARADETRHVHFGMSHVKHALRHDTGMYKRLEEAVRKRSATLAGVGNVPAAVQDALTVLAAGGTNPEAIAKGHKQFQELLEVMHENRVKRLYTAGFTFDQAETISALHTPNFM